MAAAEMDDLADRYAHRGVTSVFIYTREAHPAERIRHHTSMDGKRQCARAFAEECRVRRRILVDDLEGTAHRGFGLLPNMTWIVGRGGRIFYKASWTTVADLEAALTDALDAVDRRARDRLVWFYSERIAWRVRDDAAFRAGLERSGPQAVSDFYGDKTRAK